MSAAGCLVREDPHRAEGPGRDIPQRTVPLFLLGFLILIFMGVIWIAEQ